MMIQIRLFAAMRHEFGADVVVLELPHPATVADLRAEFARRCTRLAPWLARVRFAINECYVDDDQTIAPDAAVACIPPVSGG